MSNDDSRAWVEIGGKVICAKGDCTNLATPLRPGQPTVCVACCEIELGERLIDLQIRTSHGWTRKQYDKAQDEQERSDRMSRARNHYKF